MLLKIFLYFVIQNELVPKPHFLNIDISLQVLYFFRQRYLLFGVSQRILKYVAQFLRNLCNFAVISFLLTNFKLNTLADYYNIHFNHHRAFDDALTTAKIFVQLIKKRGGLQGL